ncbi:MAG: SRPBCC family protein [Pseudomonadales bacterium]|nr:SRPBCC family protein [Pseudomonadales bacterium]
MAQARVVEVINAPVDRVWQHLGNFAGIRPGPGIDAVEYTGEGVGMTRNMRLSTGTVIEQLTHHDPAKKTFSYAIINEDSPLPFKNYSATVQLLANDDDSTTVEWTGTFEPEGIEEAKAIRFATGIYTSAIKNARAELKAD